MEELDYETEDVVSNLKSLVGSAYQAFYRRLSGVSNYNFEPSEKEATSISKFIDLLSGKYESINGIGVNYIYNYFVFQLDYWANLDTRFGKKIPLSWFIGKKAFERWLERPEHDLWHAHRTAKQYGMNECMLRDKDPSIKATKISVNEELEKNRFYGERSGLINCLETTTLYNHRSTLCLSCIHKSDCKKMLKVEYPKIYILRGYLKNEKNSIKK